MGLVSVQNVDKHNLAQVKVYLLKKLDRSMFLLGNLDQHGAKIGSHHNSGNFKCIYNTDKLSGVFCLTVRGNLLITADSEVLTNQGCEQILDQLVMEPINIRCILGSWNAVDALTRAFVYNGIWPSWSSRSKEVTFINEDLEATKIRHPNIRLLQEDDFESWLPLRLAYLKEVNLSPDLSLQQFKDAFSKECASKTIWGYFENELILGVSACNSRIQDIFQVGGVYTRPEHRSEGIAKHLVQHQNADMCANYNAKIAVLFTAEDNLPAQKAYSRVGFQKVGAFGISSYTPTQMRT